MFENLYHLLIVIKNIISEPVLVLQRVGMEMHGGKRYKRLSETIRMRIKRNKCKQRSTLGRKRIGAGKAR